MSSSVTDLRSISSNRKRVGLIGYGLLGRALSRRLAAGGYLVSAFDKDALARNRLCDDGVNCVLSASCVVSECEPIVVSVYSTEQVAQLFDEFRIDLGQKRSAGRTILCATTLDPDRVEALGHCAEDLGMRFVEFPISGTSRQVVQEDALGLLGGDPETILLCRDIINALTPSWLYVGPLGHAAKAKLAINLVLEVNRSAFAEGLVFAEAMGLNLAVIERAMRASAAGSRVMAGKGAKMRTGDFVPEGRISQSLKDIRMMIDVATNRGRILPLTRVQEELLAACVLVGEGDLDGAAVIQEIRRRQVETKSTQDRRAE
jgi:3-hydroxyisobutyrate dehydrogenase-like beta-hydroxyacid dehydrogenase